MAPPLGILNNIEHVNPIIAVGWMADDVTVEIIASGFF